MSKWMVGLYEDDHDQAFIGVEGGSICWIDNLTRNQATAIVKAHNALEQRVERLEEIEQACIKLYVGEITKTQWRHVVRNGPLAKKLIALAEEEA